MLRVLLQGVDALGPNEENCCPITLDKFENSEVDFLPGECIIKKHPNLCIGVLPCGHKCSAVPLLFHMLVSGVKCPMCRQGPDQSMRSRCIPPHLREAMLKEEARIRREVSKATSLFATSNSTHVSHSKLSATGAPTAEQGQQAAGPANDGRNAPGWVQHIQDVPSRVHHVHLFLHHWGAAAANQRRK